MDDIRLLVEHGLEWKPPVQAGYVDEAQLQALIAANPHLVPGLGREAVTAREFPTAAGPVDVVIVDSDGQITVVECKRNASSQSRREIVGQALDYAGRLWQMPLTEFQARFASKAQGRDPVETLGLDGDALLAVETALAQGRFRLVLALDVLNENLCRLVDYLNGHTADSLTVIAMELRHWEHQGVRMLIPRTYGEEAARVKEQQADPSRATWTLEDSRTWLQTNRPGLAPLFDEVTARFAGVAGCKLFWTRSKTPSLVIEVVDASGVSLYPYRIELGRGEQGILEVHFRWTSKASETRRLAFLDALAKVTQLEIDSDDVLGKEWRTRPVRSLSLLEDPIVLDGCVMAIEALRGSAT